MVFREGLYYKLIKNRPGLNPKKYPYLRRLYYYNIRIKGRKARNKNPPHLKIY